MIKKYKTFLNEGKGGKYPELEKHAHEVLNDIAPDLPRRGNYRYLTATDHIGDRLSDKFSKSHPHLVGKFGKVAKEVVSRYEDNDTADSRKRERAALRPKKQPKVKEPTSTTQKLKPRRGIGSY